MTDLSPAAKKVLEAVILKTYNLPLERVPDYAVRKWSIAVSAALWAVVNYCPRERRILMTIAEELENNS